MIIILLLCGIFIGLLNITTREAPTVLIATIALLVVSAWITSGSVWYNLYDSSAAIWENIAGIVTCLAILMMPAAVIISIKAVLATANRD